MTDNARYFRDLFEDANRANVSFYPVDPRGFPAVDTDIGPAQPLPPALDRAVLEHRIDTLRMLAENTDGIAPWTATIGQTDAPACRRPHVVLSARIRVHEREAGRPLQND